MRPAAIASLPSRGRHAIQTSVESTLSVAARAHQDGRSPESLDGRSGLPAFRVVHSLPGRVRLRLSPDGAAEGAGLADRLASHPAVRGSRWTAAARSLTVEFDPDVSFQEILGALPGEA